MQDDLVGTKLINIKDKIASAYIDLLILIDLIDKDVITNDSYILLDELKEVKQNLRQICRQIKQL